jgi:GTP cyclohydrolase IB
MLEDIQSHQDGRQLSISAVGVTGVRYPIAVSDRERGKQDTIADITMTVDLPADVRGAHLSRFIEVIHSYAGEVSLGTVPIILRELQRRSGASTARLDYSYPYFTTRTAPVSGAPALIDYNCRVSGEIRQGTTRTMLCAQVPVTSVCPCSKAISDYGAHNQRSHITICVSPLLREDDQFAWVWAEELIEIAESAASCPVFPLLKRPDERYVTMQAYDNPVFVEDMVRNAAQELGGDDRLSWYSVQAISEESIHNHGAFARIESATCEGWHLMAG